MTKSTVTIPAHLIAKLEAWGKLTARLFGELRREAGFVPEDVPEDQKWFWSKAWQEMERQADEDFANGDYFEFDNVDDAIKHLNDQV